jgi:formylglycine-generating enzyme required for sulfatase activity
MCAGAAWEWALDDLLARMTPTDPGAKVPSIDEVITELKKLQSLVQHGLREGVLTYLATFRSDPHRIKAARIQLPYVALRMCKAPEHQAHSDEKALARSRAAQRRGSGEEEDREPIAPGALFVEDGEAVHFVALTGDPGTGKTTFLKKVWGSGALAALDALAPSPQGLEPVIPWPPKIEGETEVEVPVYLTFKQVARCGNSVADALAAAYPDLGPAFREDRDVRWLLLLDALDEVPAGSAREGLFDKLRAWMTSGICTEKRVRCIVASRTVGFPPGWGNPERRLCRLKWGSEELGEFVGKYEARDLLAKIRNDSPLCSAMQFPRFASMVCTYFVEHDRELPATLGKLYDDQLGRQLRDEPDPRGTDPERGESVRLVLTGYGAQKQALLQELAWELLGVADPEQWAAEWTRPQIEQRIDRFAAKLGERERMEQEVKQAYPTDPAKLRAGRSLKQQLFDELSTCAGLLVAVGEQTFDFLDRSWWGYLAARHAISAGIAPAAVARYGFDAGEHRFRDDCEDLLLFFAEAQADAAFLDALWRVNKDMALRCYEISGEARRGSIIDALLWLEQELGIAPPLRELCYKWSGLALGPTGASFAISEQLFREKILPQASIELSRRAWRWLRRTKVRVIQEDGRGLWFVKCCLDKLRGNRRQGEHHGWARKLYGELFEQKLELEGRPAMVAIDPGVYGLGADYESGDNPEHDVELSAFALAAYPVTNEEYEQLDPFHERPSFQVGQRDHPVVNVSWYEAFIFALRTGCQLPAEAQWEAAARGKDGRKWPWRNSADLEQLIAAIEREPPRERKGKLMQQLEEHAWFYEKQGTAPVRAAGGPARPKGAALWNGQPIYDLAGNVREWCRDWYEGEHPAKLARAPVKDPPGPEHGNTRVVRGGSWKLVHPLDVPAASRVDDHPDARNGDVGFRCSRASG